MFCSKNVLHGSNLLSFVPLLILQRRHTSVQPGSFVDASLSVATGTKPLISISEKHVLKLVHSTKLLLLAPCISESLVENISCLKWSGEVWK